MYLTKERIIYSAGEHLTFFPKDTAKVEGYELLKTVGERSKYGINTVPVYMTRDEKVEQFQTAYRLKEEHLLEATNISQSKQMLQQLKLLLFQRSVALAYERVHIFPKYSHTMVDVSEANVVYYTPQGYTIAGIELLLLNQKSYVDLLNVTPVICEKCLGEESYSKFGVPLDQKDASLLMRRLH